MSNPTFADRLKLQRANRDALDELLGRLDLPHPTTTVTHERVYVTVADTDDLVTWLYECGGHVTESPAFDGFRLLVLHTNTPPRADGTAVEVRVSCSTPAQADSHDTDQPADLTIYRAAHDSIVMGHYTSRDAARTHCETELRRELGDDAPLSWAPDDDTADAPEELRVGYDAIHTGYVVTALAVAAAYDPDADQ